MANIITFKVIILMFRVVISAVPDPCNDVEPPTRVAEMCTSSTAEEQTNSGSKNLDSVVLRVRAQKDGCICHVTIDSEISFAAYVDTGKGAPQHNPCGLVVDVGQIESNTEQFLNTITCNQGISSESGSISMEKTLTLTSNVTEGSFTSGYCITIARAHDQRDDILKLTCTEPGMIPPVHNLSRISTSTTSITTKGITSVNDVKETSTLSISLFTTSTFGVRESATNFSLEEKPKDDDDLPMYIGIGVAGVFVAVVVVFVVICCNRKQPKNSANADQSTVRDAQGHKTNRDEDGLQYNVMYVSADHTENTERRHHNKYQTTSSDTANKRNESHFIKEIN